MRKLDTNRIVRIAFFSAVALILSLVENMLPPILAFAPGAKMGLANVVSLAALIMLGTLDSYVVVIVRVLLAALFGGNVTALMYSAPSALASLTVMVLLYQFVFPRVSLMGISFCGAYVFNFVQLTVAALIVQNAYIYLMLPSMVIASAIAGLFVGLSAHFLIKTLPISVYARRSYTQNNPDGGQSKK